ncbi:putative NLI interacting factor-like phosphatase [Hamiltosporidium magnivora]|uniref:Putative NLI interacting factor-like phosphatase n=1 Tax=Hamiltosporidium magnivora TaxID=148818 RepID=A0A4Q9L4V1_9MICR|nr:putative NLI interacting factor-like phosphatase [Hamiltosporidium magnivora]
MFVKNVFLKLKNDYKKQKFPYFSTFLLASGVGVYFLGKPKEGESKRIIDYVKRSINKSKRFLWIEKEIPTLPNQIEKKPVILFDIDNFLSKTIFSFYSFDYILKKRQFNDVFLFHLAHMYELVAISQSNKYIGDAFIRQIDPYGCFAYKIFLEDKTKFCLKNLNRPLENTVFISTKNNEFNKEFEKNILYLNPWNGKEDKKLLSLLDFFTNLFFVSSKDWRNTLFSYQNKDFFNEYSKIQRKLFDQKHFFRLQTDDLFQNKIKQINDERIGDFYKAKIFMDQKIQMENQKSGFLSKFNWLVKKIVF